MRPTARQQSAIHFPLNHILGTEANVRVLRAIYLSDIPIGVAELARVTALQRSGVARVCVRLEDLGVIETVGRGPRNRQYRRADGFPLANRLSSLFQEERSRGDQIINDIRRTVLSVGGGVRSAWIEGPVATGDDLPEDSIEVHALVDSAHIDRVRNTLWQALVTVQQNRDVAIDLRVESQADLETASPDHVSRLTHIILLAGPAPLDLLHPGADLATPNMATPHRNHSLRDEQALALAYAIAARIKRDPSIVEAAKRYVTRRLAAASPGEQLELREWNDLLSTRSPARLARFLTESSERATRLRQSLPFLDALPPDERKAILADAGSAP